MKRGEIRFIGSWRLLGRFFLENVPEHNGGKFLLMGNTANLQGKLNRQIFARFWDRSDCSPYQR